MNHNHFLKITFNFLAVILLVGLIATPIYFAKTFTKVSGVKSESKYLVVPQVEKFPGMVLTQRADQYAISFTKLGSSQAYLSVLIVNNPTNETQTYSLERLNLTGGSTSNMVFFGQDLENQQTQISVPAQTSVPISLFSPESTSPSQTVEFTIRTD